MEKLVKFTGSRSNPYQNIRLSFLGKTKFYSTPKTVQRFACFIADVKHRNDWNVDVDDDGNIHELPDMGVVEFSFRYAVTSIKTALCEHDFEDTTDISDAMENGSFEHVCRKCGYTISGFMC